MQLDTTRRPTPNQPARRRAARPAHPDDGRHAAAWAEFSQLLDATTRGQSDRARSIAGRIAEMGYRVESGSGLLRLVLPERQRRTA